jgi:phosphopentomutase
MPRAFVLIFDSFGIGASLDAPQYGDAGADTLGHIADYCADVRKRPLHIPNLLRWGLGVAALASTGRKAPGLERSDPPEGAYGYAVERSKGKDTPSGHWEIAGVPVFSDWGYFSKEYPSFPAELTDAFIQQAQLPGILGNKHASGTEIIQELGDKHIATGKPIVYTSGDSVFQIAAHEEHFGLERLYALCQIARELVNPYRIGRVIARPFTGTSGHFVRTGNRRDLSVSPPEPTLLDKLVEANHTVISIGKIADIFAHQGITQKIKANGNEALFNATLEAASTAPDRSLIFTNFVDFDMLYGHRRDTAGYAAALEALDARLPELENCLRPDDIIVVAADHGCDPTVPGSDHTREHIPVLWVGPNVIPGFLGRRDTFADIGQSLASFFGIAPLEHGVSFYKSFYKQGV